MTALLTTLLSAIIPILLNYLSGKIGATSEQKVRRDDLRELNKAQTDIEVASVWKRHDDHISSLLLKARAKRRNRNR